MQKKSTRTMTGIGIGMAIGGASGALCSSVMGNKNPMKKKASKALRSMEDMLSSLQYMLK